MRECLLSAVKACFTGTRTRCNKELSNAQPQPAARLRLPPIPTSACRVCPSRSSPSCARPRRSGGASRPRARPAGSTTAATGWSPSTTTSKRCRGAATSSPAAQNGAIPRFNDDIAREDIEVQRFVMLNMDAPQHTRLRKIISRGFTPRAVERLRDELSQRAQNIAKTAAARGRRRLRRAGVVRAAAAGHRRTARRAAGGPQASSSAGPTR